MENLPDFVRILVFGGIVAAGLLIFVLFGVFLNLLGKRRERRRESARAEMLGGVSAARARIVDLRRAELQRSREFTIFRVLFEVSPADSEPFSTAVVLEVEPSALTAMQTGVVMPVKYNPKNLREIHPQIAGARYSDDYQHAHLGIENDIQAPQMIAAAGIAPQAPKENTIYRRRSQTRVFGLPLWEVAFNLIRKKGNLQYAPRNAKARAVFAVGDSATGIFALGGFAKGIVAFGNFALGLFAFGAGAVGIFAAGAMSFGGLAVGALSGGLLSFGGIAAGFASAGFLTVSLFALGKNERSAEIAPLIAMLQNASGLDETALRSLVEYAATGCAVAGFAFFILWSIAQAVLVKYLEPNDNRLESPRR